MKRRVIKMIQKYQIGDEVSVEFIGKITKVELIKKKPLYIVEQTNGGGAWGLELNDSQISSLSQHNK